MAKPLEFRVLGDLQARVGGDMLNLGHARQRLLLAALLVDADRVKSDLSDRWAAPERAGQWLAAK